MNDYHAKGCEGYTDCLCADREITTLRAQVEEARRERDECREYAKIGLDGLRPVYAEIERLKACVSERQDAVDYLKGQRDAALARVGVLEATIREVGECAALLEQMSGIFAIARAALSPQDGGTP